MGQNQKGAASQFVPRHRPDSRRPDSRTNLVVEDSYSIKVNQLSAPDGSLATGNFYGNQYKKAQLYELCCATFPTIPTPPGSTRFPIQKLPRMSVSLYIW